MYPLPSQVNEELTIGPNSGKTLSITPNAYPLYQELVQMAKKNNHWARVTVEGIHRLTSGRLSMNNIFVKPNYSGNGGYEEFLVSLPACKVTVERTPDDRYKILGFEVDQSFFEEDEQYSRPALYRCWSDEKVAPIESPNGRIKSQRNRAVIVADNRYSKPIDTIDNASSCLSSMQSVSTNDLEEFGFDMHFTPKGKQIGGLINLRDAINPCRNESLYGSAQLLAKTMYDAKNSNNINWLAERGGSAVITQAMNILADKGVKLKDHSLFLYYPTTLSTKAYQYANKLDMKISGDFKKVSPIGTIGNLDTPALIYRRFKNGEDGSYKLGHACNNIGKYSTNLAAGTALVGGVASAAALAIGTSLPTAASMGAAMPASMVFAAAILKALPTAVGSGVTLLDTFAPDRHAKLKRNGWIS